MKSIPSSAPFLDSTRWAEAAGTTDALRTLARGVTRARAFALFFAVCNKPWERDQLIAMLAKALPGTSMHRVELTAQTTDVLAEICLQAPQPQGPVLVVGLEQAVPSDTPHHEVLAALNLQRPQWPARLPYPVIFWVPQYVLGFLEREAPDFFDWRSDTISFPDLAKEEVDHLRRFVWNPAVDGSLNVEARQARTQELRARLEQSPPSDDPVARSAQAGWLRELGTLLAFSGDWEQALAKLQEALAIYEALGDKRSRAVALGDIARLQAAKGEVDAALQLHQEMRGIFEALGDKRSRAVTLGDIANILSAKGEVDAALQLHQERLGIFEALGDKLSRAVTLGDIARIRADKGEVDAALQLHQEELAIYEASGDKRSRAQTLADMAHISLQKGDAEKAIKLQDEALLVAEELGDLDGVASTLWSIAQIYLSQQNLKAAFEPVMKSYATFLKIGRLQGISIVGVSLGQLLCMADQREQGLVILTRSRDGFRQLGRQDYAQHTQALLDQLAQSP